MFESFDQEALQKIGAGFERHRLRLGLKRWHVARDLGHADLEAGCRWMMRLEDGSGLLDASDVATKLAQMLEMDLPATLEHARTQQNARFRARHRAQPMWIGPLLRHARLARHLRVEEVLERAGLGATRRNIQRLTRYESGEYRFPARPTLDALADALEVSAEILHAATRREWSFYDELAEAPHLVARLMPAIYNRVKYPDGLRAQEIFAFAREFSTTHNLRVCMTLAPPGGRSFYIEPDGSYSESFHAPTMNLTTGAR